MIEYTVKVYDNKVYDNGDKGWYLNGKLHREDGPAFEGAGGDKVWWLNGKRHREDGPAIEWANGSKSWYLNDKLHREDGPAIEGANGSKTWCLNGKRLTEAEFKNRMDESCSGKVVEIEGVKDRLEEV